MLGAQQFEMVLGDGLILLDEKAPRADRCRTRPCTLSLATLRASPVCRSLKMSVGVPASFSARPD